MIQLIHILLHNSSINLHIALDINTHFSHLLQLCVYIVFLFFKHLVNILANINYLSVLYTMILRLLGSRGFELKINISNK